MEKIKVFLMTIFILGEEAIGMTPKPIKICGLKLREACIRLLILIQGPFYWLLLSFRTGNFFYNHIDSTEKDKRNAFKEFLKITEQYPMENFEISNHWINITVDEVKYGLWISNGFYAVSLETNDYKIDCGPKYVFQLCPFFKKISKYTNTQIPRGDIK